MYIKKVMIICFLIMGVMQSCKTYNHYKTNQIFEINLENEGAGGYKWSFVKTPDIEVVDSSQVVLQGNSKLVSYEKKYKLKGLKKGAYILTFHHLRNFEKNDTIPEENIKIINVRIK
ncbi:protease inhibitor I42 family protein [Bizionia arctica]|uniref:Proteinase inhibitor I42 chagasin domain-containing protein n=1 Tax=Bizionia arctica TaxID=1495645 RepID=A0A917GGD8_9FLAO|nr:protease inhibitor I42 family protein [Bizionia arctica]GGG45009.1 hypothetical protein GCM10010976_15760 [Bizionia arctica]